MMTGNLCLLCLHLVEESGVENPTRKIQIATLCELIAPSRHNQNNPISYQGLFDESETCEFCLNCCSVLEEVEKIRQQISILESQVERKVRQIKETISNCSSSFRGDEGDTIFEIRTRILQATSSGKVPILPDDNFLTHEFQVKVEQEVNHDVDDQFFDDNNSYGEEETTLNYEPSLKVEDDIDSLEDDDSDFCIIPHSQKKSKRVAAKGRKSKTKTSLRTRKRSLSPEVKQPKRIKREPRPVLERTRSSPRIKSIAPPPPSPAKIPKVKKPIKKTLELKCTVCDATLSTHFALTLHMQRTHSSISCHVCDAKFNMMKDKVAHMRQIHNIGAYHCTICGSNFNRQHRLLAHMFIRHENGEKKLSCPKCEKGFALEENFKRHLELHEFDEIKPVVCDVCDCRFENEERLQTHMNSHLPKYRCEQCGQRCQSVQMLARHVRTHTREMGEKCSICDAPFRDKLTVDRHIAKEHSNTPASHICHICGKAFYLPCDLKNHLDRHAGKYQAVCDTCGETFKYKNTLEAHRVKMHGADPIICDECGALFGSQHMLKRHKEIHTGIKPFKCDFCDARFLRSQTLREHLKSHSGERPNPCPHCEKSFKTKNQRREHVNRIHNPSFVRPTPHKCPHCDKAFPRKSYLDGHIRSAHTGERPFICEECGTGFVLQTMLNQHLKVSHGVGVTTEKKERLPRSKREVVEATEDGS